MYLTYSNGVNVDYEDLSNMDIKRIDRLLQLRKEQIEAENKKLKEIQSKKR